MSRLRPRRMSWRDTTGSSTASMSSCRFSISRGMPFSRHRSTVSMYLCWDSWMIFRPASCSRFRIQLMPCSCGSIMSDQRAAFVMMAPFSMESGSVGRPWLAQRARLASPESRSSSTSPSVMGISLSLMSGIHLVFTSSSLNLLLKGPTYDTKDEARSTSPTSFSSCTPNCRIAWPQRLFSEESPFTSRSARSAFFCVLSACAMAAFLSSVAFIKFSSKLATLSWSSFTLALIPINLRLAPSSFLFASASAARLGATTW
mmetsp:Transcript_36229/g.69449  ORF Transcript_36229/g.69449 Transcript_36229/m.69449 type:complete len:259 (-) Transcript_36229:4333-5109(-)